MTGQLVILFEQPNRVIECADANIEQAERVIQKYLRVAHDVQNYWSYCYDRTKKGVKMADDTMMKRYYRVYHLLHDVGRRMILSLKVETVSFKDTENRFYEVRGHKGKESEEKELLSILDAFGYIQEEFDIENGCCEKSAYTDEDGNLDGYHYWLFEDPIAQIPVPAALLDKYYKKYGDSKSEFWINKYTV